MDIDEGEEQSGDNPAWAQANFENSQWKTVGSVFLIGPQWTMGKNRSASPHCFRQAETPVEIRQYSLKLCLAPHVRFGDKNEAAGAADTALARSHKQRWPR